MRSSVKSQVIREVNEMKNEEIIRKINTDRNNGLCGQNNRNIERTNYEMKENRKNEKERKK